MSANIDNDAADPNLTPLLDVVLQLIMFFMITVNFVRTENINEEIDLPVAQAATVLDNSPDYPIYLNLNEHGRLVGTPADLSTPEKIRVYLMGQKEIGEREARESGMAQPAKIVVILRAHKNARYREVWNVLDTCTNAGIQHWQLRVMTGGGAQS